MSDLRGAPRPTVVGRDRVRGRGFTLVELMVTLVVLAVVIAMAGPAFTLVRNSNRLTSAANEMVATLQMARMEAIRRNAPVIVCRSTNGTTCTKGDTWERWITLVDKDRDGPEATDEVVRVSDAPAPLELRASAAIADSRLTFRPNGLASNAAGTLLKGSFGVCLVTTQPADNVRTINILSGSRISTSAANGAGKCVTPLDPK